MSAFYDGDGPDDQACPECGSVTPTEGCPYCDHTEFLRKEHERLESAVRPEGMTVWSDEGTEGPRHDPYGYTDYRVDMPDGSRIRYKTGIIEELWVGTVSMRWDRLPEVMRGGGWGSGDRSIREEFERLVGWPIDQIEWWAEAPYRGSPCMACGRESGCRGRCQE